MKIKKILNYKYNKRKDRVEYYSKLYKKTDFSVKYPAELKRLNIIISLLKKHKPKKIVDAGCAAGIPLIKLKKLGFNITGYDRSKPMVNEAKKNLERYNLSTNLISEGNFENPKNQKDNSVDCILGLGTFYYSKNIKKTISLQAKKLKRNGRLIFSLRNQLFDIATMNDYSVNFFSKLYKITKYKKDIQVKFRNYFSSYNTRNKLNLRNMSNKDVFSKTNIDEKNVFSKTHNPLNIEKDLLDKTNLSLQGIYFYHFHFLPPAFENNFPVKFRRESWKIENPTDWRGFFLASGFVVDCIKNN
jgi:SAM-dependent methyltransferase